MTVTHQHTNHAHAILLSQVASGHCFNQRVLVPLGHVNVSKTESVKRVSCIFAEYKNPPALYGAERPLFLWGQKIGLKLFCLLSIFLYTQINELGM